MGVIKYAIIYNIRKKKSSLLISLVLCLLLLGEMYGLCLYLNAKNNEQRAFEYNGYAMRIDEVNLDKQSINALNAIPHITAVDYYTWYDIYPKECHMVHESTGSNPTKKQLDVNRLVLVTHSDVKVDEWFANEINVSLFKGDFPSEQNKGIVIEDKFAKENNLDINDFISFRVGDNEAIYKIKVCGIFKVDTEFILNASAAENDEIFCAHPSNRIYGNTEYFASLFNDDILQNTHRNIYIDKYSSYDEVEKNVKKILGKDVTLSNNADSYLESSTAIVSIMKRISTTILLYVSIIGVIIIQIILAFFAIDYKHEIGLLMALGYEKGKIILIYLCNMIFMVFTALILSLTIYAASHSLFMKVVDNGVIESFEKTVSEGSGGYETPGLQYAFSMEMEPFIQFSSFENLITIILVALAFLVVSISIPVYIVYTTKPRILLTE